MKKTTQVNYDDIGKRIRAMRKNASLSHEMLAERIDISLSHMTHIESGSKLSLETLVRMANALGSSVDELLCGSLSRGTEILQNEFVSLLSDCTSEQMIVILNILKTAKNSLDRYNPRSEF